MNTIENQQKLNPVRTSALRSADGSVTLPLARSVFTADISRWCSNGVNENLEAGKSARQIL